MGAEQGTYYVYRWHELGTAPVSKMREIAHIWGVPEWGTMDRTTLRWTIMRHEKNKSEVPHPLIRVPVEL